MTKVIFDMSMSLDGFVKASNATPEQPLGEGGERLHEWGFGEDERDREVLAAQAERDTGAIIAGRRTYDDSLRWWGADGPHPPTRVFVLTHETPEDVPEGSVYTFVTDGIESALEQAKSAAGDKNVAVMGGPTSAGSSSRRDWWMRSGSTSCPCSSEAAPGCSRTSAANASSSRPPA